MLKTKNTITRFLLWWKRALISPISGLVSSSNSRSTVLSLIDDQIADLSGNIVNSDQLSRYKGDREIYALAPQDKVIVKRISESQASLPIAQVVGEVLPFDISELAFSISDCTLYAVTMPDMLGSLQRMYEQGLSIKGVAFNRVDSAEMVFSDEFDKNPYIQKQTSSLINQRAWSALVVIVAILPIVSFHYLSNSEARNQLTLKQELSQLQSKVVEDQSIPVELLADNAIEDSASHVIQTLESVADSMTKSSDITQLILTRDELIMDASADSATQFRANLDNSGAFESSDFVTSISSSVDGEIERFRLTLSLKGSK